MTNLSDLFPAGAGKQVSFVADGSISAAGKPVILNGAGTVTPVAETSDAAGTPVVYEAAATDYTAATFDSSSNKVVIAYQDEGNSNYGTAIVGTVSGTSISYGTAVAFESAESDYIAATFDSNAGKVVLAYRDQGNSGYGTAVVGTVSGTSISFGTSLNFTDPNNANNIATAYDSNADRTVFTYKDSAESDGRAVVLSATTTLTIGSNYYVQPAGTLATSAGSPSVKAGLAISTTSLLLSGDS